MYKFTLIIVLLASLLPAMAQSPQRVIVDTLTCDEPICVFDGGFYRDNYDFITATSNDKFLIFPTRRDSGNLMALVPLFGYTTYEWGISEYTQFTVLTLDTVTIDVYTYQLVEPEHDDPACCHYEPDPLPWEQIAWQRFERMQ